MARVSIFRSPAPLFFAAALLPFAPVHPTPPPVLIQSDLDASFHTAAPFVGMHARFLDDRIEVVEARPRPGRPPWIWTLRTSSWGRQGLAHPARLSSKSQSEERVAYTYADGLVEWFANRGHEVEHGFTIAERPPGTGDVVLNADVESTLRPLPGAGDAINWLDADGARVLHYAELVVVDGDQRVLPSSMALTDAGLRIQFDDAAATYPVTVDPVIATPHWQGEGDFIGARFGWSVSTAGDVNGDGYSDVIVGAFDYGGSLTSQGRARVYLGGAYGPEFQPDWTFDGPNPNVHLGYSVSAAGDVNGDGYDDVLVGSPYNDSLASNAGAVYAFYGSASGLSTTPDWQEYESQPGALFGFSVCTAGDVNGDGYTDVIIGSPTYDNGQSNEGRGLIYYGSASGLEATPSWDVDGDQGTAWFGAAVSTAGDVNGDGYDDVIVGAPFFDNGQTNEGRAYVYLGTLFGVSATPVWDFEVNEGFAQFGNAVTSVGDFNGDGYGDVMVGAPFEDFFAINDGRAYFFAGGPGGPEAIPSWTAVGSGQDADFGVSVRAAGDVDGDGYADLVIGSSGWNSDRGRLTLYYGMEGAATNVQLIEGAVAGDLFSHSVSGAGDVNGDGFADIIAGGPSWFDHQSLEGGAWVHLGAPSGLGAPVQLAVEGNEAFAGLDRIGGIGDVNGDGYDDVAVGCFSCENGETDEGRAWLFHGSSSGPSSVAAWTGEGDQIGAWFGAHVRPAGDINGDGYADMCVSAVTYDSTLTDQGRANIYYGSPTGIPLVPDLVLDGEGAGDRFGRGVAAGDVNGDGYADLMIGATFYSNGQMWEGAAYLHLGSPSGLSPTDSWFVQSNQDTAFYGVAASAGDVNGDGYDDVLVSAYSWTETLRNQGKVWAYHGSETGLETSAAWTALGLQAGEGFGISLDGIGDINGDGYDDVAIGGEGFSNGNWAEGRTAVYLGSASGLNEHPAWVGEGNDDFSDYGNSVSGPGDLNGDGYGDMAIGARFFDVTALNSSDGRVFVHLGSFTGPADDPDQIFDGLSPSDFFGSAVSGAGDVNGDGFDDLLITASGYTNGEVDEGTAYFLPGNAATGGAYFPGQQRTNGETIAFRGVSDSPAEFRLVVEGWSPAGRTDVRMEWQVAPLGSFVENAAVDIGSWTDPGAPGGSGRGTVGLQEAVTGLLPDTPYRWRMRIRSKNPYFPWSPWMTVARASPTRWQLRTDESLVAATPGEPTPGSPSTVLIRSVYPNPVLSSARIAYAVGTPGYVRLQVFDLAGRAVATLADGPHEAGTFEVRWSRTGDSGVELAPGVYFARVESNGGASARKVIVSQ